MKQNRTLKKIVAMFIACFLLTLTGCKPNGTQTKEPEVPIEESSLRVLVDLDAGSYIIQPSVKRALEKFIETDEGYNSFSSTVKALGGPGVELEFPPAQGEQRDMYLTSLRTEIMAGKGPDVFVCVAGPAYDMNYVSTPEGLAGSGWMEPVFTFPQQAMKRNMFLCLDEYIPDFQFTDWERLTPVIMDAGKYKDKQYLLPMTYTMPITVFKKSDVQHTHSRDMTWNDMLSGSPELKAAAVLDTSIYQGSALAPLADPDKDELAFTEEELLEFMTEKVKLGQEVRKELPDCSDCRLAVGFDDYSLDKSFSSKDALTMVPLYSRQGGYSATVTSFTAVNANTEYPSAAAFLADYLLSGECQLSSLYAYVTAYSSVPVMEGLMQQETALPGGVAGYWHLSPENYQEFCSLRDNISLVEFSTQLGVEMQKLQGDMRDHNNRKSAENLVHDAYMRMNMMLAES